MPEAYRDNINTDQPFGGGPGGKPASSSEQDIEDIVAFLGTLTDGWEAPSKGE